MEEHDPAHEKMEMLLRPERQRLQDPEVILGAINVKPGMVIADVGAGPGFLTIPAAQKLGPNGKVYAIDVEPSMLKEVARRAHELGLANIETVLSAGEKLPLPDGIADAALLANVLHEAKNPAQMLQEVARVLKPGGSLVVIEWKKERQQMGPPVAERIAPEELERALLASRYAGIEQFAVGPAHYGMRARTSLADGSQPRLR